MKSWPRSVRAALRMGLTWAAGWAPVGILISLIVGGNGHVPDGFPLDDWLVPMALLGFVGGTTFSAVLRLAEGRRSFDELSIPRFGAWGALGGVALGALAVVVWQLDAGFGPVLWPRAAAIVGATTLLSAASAAGSLALARMGERDALGAGEETELQALPREATS